MERGRGRERWEPGGGGKVEKWVGRLEGGLIESIAVSWVSRQPLSTQVWVEVSVSQRYKRAWGLQLGLIWFLTLIDWCWHSLNGQAQNANISASLIVHAHRGEPTLSTGAKQKVRQKKKGFYSSFLLNRPVKLSRTLLFKCLLQQG